MTCCEYDDCHKRRRKKTRLMEESSLMSGEKDMLIQNLRHAMHTRHMYRVGSSKMHVQSRLLLGVILLLLCIICFIYLLPTTSATSPFCKQLIANLDTKPSVYNSTYPLSSPHTSPLGITFKIAIISDLDTLSKSSSNDNVWNSFMKRGLLRWIPERNLVTISWDHNHTILSSSMAFKGRGMELSELVVFDGKLLSFDDRTGMVYRLDANNAYPWIILTDGNGNNAKGFKSEWATVKDQQLYVGSMGKEWTTPNGEYVNNNPMWVKKISPTGQVTSIDWTENYKLLRQAYNIHFPGYMIHESAMWSAVHESWFFLPRRCSQSAFNEQLDEAMSCNIMLTADQHFKNIKVTEIGRLVKIRGFSSFKFLPGTNDSIIVALKTEEFRGQMATYIMAFNIDGTILMPELKVTDQKYEGLEFV